MAHDPLKHEELFSCWRCKTSHKTWLSTCCHIAVLKKVTTIKM